MKVLVVAPAWVGDMVMAHAVVPGLAELGHEIHVLAPPSTAALASRMPDVAEVHTVFTRHGELGWGPRRRASRSLAERHFGRAIVLPNSFKSALTPLWAGIPVRTGFRGEFRFGVLNDRRRLDEARMPRLVDRYAALADVVPANPRLQADAVALRSLLTRLGLGTDRPVVALCPGAEYGPAKRWPAERFAALAARCVEAGASVWILGTDAERQAAEEILAAAPAVDLTGRTSLSDAVDLLSAAAVAVVNDSGLMHVAAALAVPLVALFGSSSQTFTPPLSSRARVLERQLDCRPCFARTCPLGHLDCLVGIGVDQVFDTVTDLGGFTARSTHETHATAGCP
ncbi:MAG: lipopolysaccharide heptosyltransferase II [Gammaproteobacteria bacterium]|nr:lipopolysaccharide heptosyltransferase II [Gammaproteobacteria bacterium]